MSKVEQKIEDGKKITLADIEHDLNANHWDALYFAKEKQITTLIDQGRISEDFYCRWDDYQEEMRVLMAEAV